MFRFGYLCQSPQHTNPTSCFVRIDGLACHQPSKIAYSFSRVSGVAQYSYPAGYRLRLMASKYESRGETPTITRRRHVLACARCRARRVKCDRAQPTCSNCFKSGALCQPAQQQGLSRQDSVPPRSEKSKSSDCSRLLKLEEEVARLSKEVDSSAGDFSQEGSTVDADESWSFDAPGNLIFGPNTRYFSPSSWVSVAPEPRNLQDTLQPGFSGGQQHGSHPAIESLSERDDPPFLENHLHDLLLNVYSHRVDPLIRILHWPTFLKRCRAFRQSSSSRARSQSPVPDFSSPYFPSLPFGTTNQGMLPNTPVVPSQGQVSMAHSATANPSNASFIALLWSVYYAAVLSVMDGPTPPELGPDFHPLALAPSLRKEVVDRVLSLSELIRNPSIELLQASVIVLSAEPNFFDPYPQWLQLSTSIRLAQALGVHRDGTRFGLQPIDIEVRRRMWAQICILDVRFAELLGCEPSISASSYDTCLPLSICDRDLTEIDRQHASSTQGVEGNFKSYEEIEQEQEGRSPFSAMTFTLVEAEMARLNAQLFSTHYVSRDHIYPMPARRSQTSSAQQYDKLQYVKQLEHRLQKVYGLNNLDTTNTLQSIVQGVMRIKTAKATFVARLMGINGAQHGANTQQRESELTRLFHDAIALNNSILAFFSQFSTSPYGWYLRSKREVYTCSFMLFMLSSGRPLDQTAARSAWAILDQLFPIDTPAKLQEQGFNQPPLERLLAKARIYREEMTGVSKPQSGSQPRFTSSVTTPVTLPTNTGGVETFQSSGNLFEDLDAIMQEPMWVPGTDDGYGSWASQPCFRTGNMANQPLCRSNSGLGDIFSVNQDPNIMSASHSNTASLRLGICP
ncbi:hypothetical protein BCR34DRAFT_307324 [Clohesyomyces aquaticus]|uniref:Zn(2)-C6 fungal-type domain-containing protein n=1 Tax=Clohesyomyces aquaticus TaxID=1231657 RepID=A0A1Y1ZPB8_9PLEO|nr:hypothetical protein BCR34DRAFT_307324 [Clohesyomyces aquaticus]